MNQYLLFMYYKEDPAGGWEDFLDDFNDLTTCYEEIDRRINLLQIDSDEDYNNYCRHLSSEDNRRDTQNRGRNY